MISAFSYTVWSSSTFITWNTLQPGQYRQTGYSACNPNNQTPIIAAVTANQQVQIMWLRGSHPLCTQIISSINRPSPLTREDFFFLIFCFQLSPTLKLWHTIHAILVTCELQWILLLLFVGFSRFEFSRKNLMYVSFSVMCIIFTYTLPTSLLSIVVWIDRVITCAEILYHNWCFRWELS